MTSAGVADPLLFGAALFAARAPRVAFQGEPGAFKRGRVFCSAFETAGRRSTPHVESVPVGTVQRVLLRRRRRRTYRKFKVSKLRVSTTCSSISTRSAISA